MARGRSLDSLWPWMHAAVEIGVAERLRRRTDVGNARIGRAYGLLQRGIVSSVILGAFVIAHYVLSNERVRWLVSQRT